VRGLRPPRWPATDAVANMAVIDALFASLKKGRAMPVKDWRVLMETKPR